MGIYLGGGHGAEVRVRQLWSALFDAQLQRVLDQVQYIRLALRLWIGHFERGVPRLLSLHFDTFPLASIGSVVSKGTRRNCSAAGLVESINSANLGNANVTISENSPKI